MTPAARYAAAIEVLDLIGTENPAEKVLTTWARQNRYAGSKDRAAVRDHVYDVLRRRRSLAALGGGHDGRALILGLLRSDGIDVADVFGAGGYGPEALTAEEVRFEPALMSPDEACDIPSWLWPMWQDDLGAEAAEVGKVLQHRAPVNLRVNLRRGTLAAAQAALAGEDIATRPVDQVKTALEVLENPRRVATSAAFRDGLIEVQDVASQRAMLALVPHIKSSVLDYCAGGGGKALALADLSDAQVVAHDISSRRMADIPTRAARAGVTIGVETAPRGPFDAVLCDAPCSGSGTWRRTPDAKWNLTSDRLTELNEMQAEVIRNGADLTASGGVLAYATCSVLGCENDGIVTGFLDKNSDFQLETRHFWRPDAHQDGFFLAMLRRV